MACSDDMDARLTRMETILERIDRDLWGNGQPGRCTLHDERIQHLERARWIIYGVLIMLSVGLSGLGLGGATLRAWLR